MQDAPLECCWVGYKRQTDSETWTLDCNDRSVGGVVQSNAGTGAERCRRPVHDDNNVHMSVGPATVSEQEFGHDAAIRITKHSASIKCDY